MRQHSCHFMRVDRLSEKVRTPGLEITLPVCVKTVNYYSLLGFCLVVSNPRWEGPFLPSRNENKAEIVYTKCPVVLMATFELKLSFPLVLKDL